MSETQAILNPTTRITAFGIGLACVSGAVTGQGSAALGFALGAAIILANLLVLAFAANKITSALVHGAPTGLAEFVLKSRFLITVLSVLTIGSLTSMVSVMAGVVFVFSTLISVAFWVASVAHLPAPMESL